MADDNDLERTEPASPRRLEQAREEGQVARSPELATFAVLAAATGGLWLAGGDLVARLARMLAGALEIPRSAAFDAAVMPARLLALSGDALAAFAPFALVVLAAAIGAPLLINGWVFSAKAVQPDFGRLDPVAGLGRIFSPRSAAELGKAIAKALVVGAFAAAVAWHYKEALLGLAGASLRGGLAELARIAGVSIGVIVAGMLLIVAVDVPFQLWDHFRRLRMSREELKRENRETEGDPQMKARVRSLQREAARRRMMAEVPKADVVVTNPTHYAVALRYDVPSMRAPRVVAKGMHLVAARIREIAEEHRVPVIEAAPLARALYHHTNLDDEIPEALYTVVAELLVYVYRLRHPSDQGAPGPRAPVALPVPPHLDPGV